MRRLILLLWLPSVVLAQQPYYGTTVSVIRISEETTTPPPEDLPLHVGDTLTPENLRAAIQTLFGTGRYRTIDADVTPSGNGTQVTFNVTRHTFFSTFTLVPPNLLDRPLSALIRLPVGQKFSQSRLDEIVLETRQTLEHAGYFEAEVTSSTQTDTKRGLRSVELRATVRPKAKIRTVAIAGAAGVMPDSELQNTFKVSSGDTYNADAIESGLAALKAKLVDLNYLSTRVTATPEYDSAENEVRLTVTVNLGQPAIVDAGPDLSRSEVRKLLPVFEEGSFDTELLREGRDRIVQHLQEQGYFEAAVSQPAVIESPISSAPTRIQFAITPGDRHHVRSVQFQGNSFFTKEQLLTRIHTRPASFPTFLNRGVFSDRLLQADVAAIQTLYRRAGFEAAFIEGRRTDDPNHAIDVVFDITENSRYPVENVVFSGNHILDENDLRSVLRVKEGSVYSPTEAENDRTALIAHYYELGFPDIRIDATADRIPATGGRTLTYTISEGPRYRVGEILVAGNSRTAEKVIKRASGLKEYTWFNPEGVLEAQQRLYATGLFSHVDVVALDGGSSELRTILIQIEEGKAILVTPGLGVKEYAGPRVTLDISHNNLLGLNRSLTLRFRLGVHEQQFQSTYREPRLLNRESLDGYGTFTAEKTNQLYFEAARLELAVQVRKKMSRSRSILVAASYQTVNLQDIKLNPVVRLFPDLKGIIHISRIGSTFLTDTRDDALDPRQGKFTRSEVQVASRQWGSEVNFVSLFHQTGYYHKLGRGTAALSGRLAWKNPYGRDKELPITERYFAGGSTTLRGFGLDKAGPPGGGQLMTIANAEYRIPFKSLSVGELGGAFFYDGGNVFERPSQFSLTDFTHTAGLGLRFLTPLGPIRLDFGFNLHPRLRTVGDGSLQREARMKTIFTLGHAF